MIESISEDDDNSNHRRVISWWCVRAGARVFVRAISPSRPSGSAVSFRAVERETLASGRERVYVARAGFVATFSQTLCRVV